MWEEPFRFLIHDPKYQELDIEVSWIFVSFSFDYCWVKHQKKWKTIRDGNFDFCVNVLIAS